MFLKLCNDRHTRHRSGLSKERYKYFFKIIQIFHFALLQVIISEEEEVPGGYRRLVEDAPLCIKINFRNIISGKSRMWKNNTFEIKRYVDSLLVQEVFGANGVCGALMKDERLRPLNFSLERKYYFFHRFNLRLVMDRM